MIKNKTPCNKSLKNTYHEKKISFNRYELSIILSLYGKMVAIGEWRDYGISILNGLAVFSIYKNASEYPVYMVKKSNVKFSKDYTFSVVAMDGMIVKRANKICSVLKPLEKKLIRIIK